MICTSVHDGGELPGEVHGVADAGVHALSADRTVDVRGVAEQERAALAEPIGDPMVHAVGREPVHALDVDAHPLDDAPAHVVPGQLLVLVLGVRAHGADEPRATVLLQRKDGEEIARVQGRVQLAVHRRAARFDVGDVEEMIVGAAWEANPQRFAARSSARRRSRRRRPPRRFRWRHRPASIG